MVFNFHRAAPPSFHCQIPYELFHEFPKLGVSESHEDLFARFRVSSPSSEVVFFSRNRSDVFAMWPTADVGFMDPETGVNVVFGITRQDDPEEFERCVAKLSEDAAPWEVAAMFEAQDVIDPRETRKFLINMLEVQ